MNRSRRPQSSRNAQGLAPLVLRAIQRRVEKIYRFRALPAVFARVSLHEPTKFDELGWIGFRVRPNFPQPKTQGVLRTEGIRTTLEKNTKLSISRARSALLAARAMPPTPSSPRSATTSASSSPHARTGHLKIIMIYSFGALQRDLHAILLCRHPMGA
jgi:hypothetical protein